MAKSAFDPSGQDQPLRTGINANLGPTGMSHSKMPDNLVDGKVEKDEREVDCNGADANEPVCEIEKAVREKKVDPDRP